ncbi:transglycosylase SLT domain-containing protein [Trichlorobacter ammonificans]|uniref:Membrane-bound lytic murein transglycosylase D n=1 Tax=Trichlorobacter ammonificans TaxID=2916410 RepID=A0ABN8HGE1_9BACT|nr:transglycosylase SLT domain-containing protein [Trichlorobacter ammonificans]CAH2030208.1 Membrane-bound lytic murein transglycosylase D precursor [Trichlorobacter ammonificans]
MRPLHLLTLLLAIAMPAHAGEPVQSLLHELIQPQALTGSTAGSAIQQGTGSSAAAPPSNLFTLEELHKGQDNDPIADLHLPDDDLPAADLPLALNDKVERFITLFQTKGRATFAGWLQRSTRYLPMMREVLRKEGLPEELVYLAMIESGFRLHARSVASAVGPWQFMPATGRRYALRIDQWVDERRDPVKATAAAAMYLKDLYGMFNGDWHLATAGYNAGENKIMRAMDKYDTTDFWELSKGSYLKRETKEYVPKLLAAAIIAKDPARYGFNEIVAIPVVESDTVVIKARTDLELVARLTGTTVQTIKDLNPSLRHWCTPPNYPDFELRVPKGTGKRFETAIAGIPVEQWYTEKTLYGRYHAGRKDTLASVARRFGTSAGELAELNGLGRTQKVAGRTLVVPARQSVNFAREGRREEATPDIRYYTVRKGDTLWTIARKFKVSTTLLTAWNNLKHETAALLPGKRLVVARNSAAPKNPKG